MPDAHVDAFALEASRSRLDLAFGADHPFVMAQVTDPQLIEEELAPQARVRGY